MKGIVVEIINHTAAVLSEEGCVVKVSNNNYQIGQEVEISMKKQIKLKKVFAFASAAACLLVVSGISAYTYYTPYTYVSLDVNPSIEYSVNRFDRVLSVKGVNDDGTEIINEIELDNLENKSIENAIASTVDEITNAGYLDSNTGGMVITTSSDNMAEADKLAQTLENVVTEGVENSSHEAIVSAEAVGAERVAEAQALGVTPGKLNLVEKLLAYTDDAENMSKEEWLHKSVKDIMAKTKEYKKQNQEKEQNVGEEIQNQEQNTNEEQNGETKVNGEAKGQSKDPVSENSNNGNGSGNLNNSNAGNDSDTANDSKPETGSGNSNNSNPGNGSGNSINSNAGNGSENSNSNAGNGYGNSNNSNKKRD